MINRYGINTNPTPPTNSDENAAAQNSAVAQVTNTTQTPQTTSMRDERMLLASDVTVGDVEQLLEEIRNPPSSTQSATIDLHSPRQSIITRLNNTQIVQCSGYDFREMNNCCAEYSLCALATLLKSRVQFNLGHYRTRNQQPSLIDAIHPEMILCVGNQGQPDFSAWFASLEESQHYLVRRGTQAGDGHHFVLTCVNGDWFAIDTSSSAPIQLTLQNRLFMENCRRLFDPGRGINWGRRYNEYCLFYVPVAAPTLAQLCEHLREQRRTQFQYPFQ
ncbi:MAG: hypothetical protein ACRC24_05880 [Vibrionaceae bacterium]